jgi:hypothetical protein
MGNVLDSSGFENIDRKFDIDKKIEQKLNRRQHAFFYIQGSAPDKKGRMRGFLLGPYGDSAMATSIASAKRMTSYTVIELETSDLGRASQILKARRLHGNSDISEVFERMKHKM